MNSAEFAVN